MAATVAVTVGGTLLDGAGAAVTSANVKAQRVDPQTLLATTLASADVVTALSNSTTGIFSLALTGYDLTPVTYKITFPDGQYAYVRLPANAKSTSLGIVLCGATPAKTVRDITPQFANLYFIGQDIASATTIVPTCDYHAITGTVAITALTATSYPVGKILTLEFNGILTFKSGGILKIAGNFTTSALDSINLRFNGTNWIEMSRSANA